MGFFDKARGKLAVRTNEGASPRMQALWRSMPAGQKNQLRRTLPDSDRDGVPDKFDCQPFNPRRQDDPITKSLDRQVKIMHEREAGRGKCYCGHPSLNGRCQGCGADVRDCECDAVERFESSIDY